MQRVTGFTTPAVCEDGEYIGGSIDAIADCGFLSTIGARINWDDSRVSSLYRDNLAAGEYCVTVETLERCSFRKCFTITGPQEPAEIRLESIVYPSGCLDGNCDGEITISSQSVGSLKWYNPDGTITFGSAVRTNLCRGRYVVEINDGMCSVSKTINLSCCISDVYDHYIPLTISPLVENNSISLNLNGGGVVSTIWTGPDNFYSESIRIYGLADGEYCVTIQDGCTSISDCFLIGPCEGEIEPVISVFNPCETVLFSGEIIVEHPLGDELYVQWSDGFRGATRRDLSPGVYSFLVKDKTGCLNENYEIELTLGNLTVTDLKLPECGKLYVCDERESLSLGSLQITYPDCFTVEYYCPTNEGEPLIVTVGPSNVIVGIGPTCQRYTICANGSDWNRDNGTYSYGLAVNTGCGDTGYSCFEYCTFWDGAVHYGTRDGNCARFGSPVYDVIACPLTCKKPIFCDVDDDEERGYVCVDAGLCPAFTEPTPNTEEEFIKLFYDYDEFVLREREYIPNIFFPTDSFLIYQSGSSGPDDVKELNLRAKSESSVTVLPNPSFGIFEVDFEIDYELVRYEVSSMQGIILASNKFKSGSKKSNVNVNISHLPAGVYMLTVMTSSGQILSSKLSKM
ncbi:MAG: T9SS type A sorting domain-containing protein [Saprospiraceae bacterium]